MNACVKEMAADAWGVGCVGFFCLKGRPLFYGDEETVCTLHCFDCCAVLCFNAVVSMLFFSIRAIIAFIEVYVYIKTCMY